MHFVFYPYLYVNHFVVNSVYDHLNSISSSCFAVIFHVSPCSEYSLWWVVELNAVSPVFRGLTVCFVAL